MARPLTAADVRELTGYSRDEFRGLLNAVPDLAPGACARVAREYTAHELMIFAVIHVLDARIGLRRNQIAAILTDVRTVLSGPRALNRNAWLVVSFDPLRVAYLDKVTLPHEGVAVRLGPIFNRVDEYLGAGLIAATTPPFNLGPALVGSRRKRSVG